MFVPRSPRHWPPVAALFALLIAATFTCGETASAQTPASVPPATPAPASSLPSMAAPTPATSQNTPSQQQTSQPAQQQPAQTTPDKLEQPIQVQNPPKPAEIPPAVPVASVPSMPAYGPMPEEEHTDALGSSYIPVDSIVYPLTLRLYSLGYLDDAFIAMRPWTRRSLLHMLQKSADDITSDGDPQAMSILAYLQDYLVDETPPGNLTRGAVYGIDTAYTRLMGIGGP